MNIKTLLYKILKNIHPSSLNNCKLGKKAKVCSKCELYNVEIGDYSYIGHYSCVNNCTIGKYSSIANNCSIGGASHPISWISTSPIFYSGNSVIGRGFSNKIYNPYKQTKIGHDVWIGTKTLIKSGVSIGNGAIIGMGSVVTHSVPDYEIWAGNPAKFIRKRFDEDVIEDLKQIRWWNLPKEELIKFSNVFDNPKEFIKKYKNKYNK